MGSVWHLTQTGKLLGAGVLGVMVIAASVYLQNGHDAKRTAQTLITPSGALGSPVPPELGPAQLAPKSDTAGDPARAAGPESSSGTSGALTGTPVESLQKSSDKKDDRHDKAAKDHASTKPDSKGKTPSKSSSKGIDFGI
jgi:hypothetical protein